LILAATSTAAGYVILRTWRSATTPSQATATTSPCKVVDATSSYQSGSMQAVWKFEQCGDGARCSASIQDNPPHTTIWTGKPDPDGVCTLPHNTVKAGQADFTVVLSVKPVSSDIVDFKLTCPAAGGACRTAG